MPQLPNSRPPRPARIRLTERTALLDDLEQQFRKSSLQLFAEVVSDDDESDTEDDGQSRQSTPQPSSVLSLSLSSPLSSFRVSPISDASVRIRDSSLAPSSQADEPDELDLFTLLRQKFQFLHDQIMYTRYLNPRIAIPHNSQLDLLWWYKANSPLRFRRKVRVGPSVFDHLLSLIEHDDVFITNSIRTAIPVQTQLAIFLNRIGHYGNASSLDDIAEWAGVSLGTVSNCTKRCMLAFIKYHNQAMASPTEHEIALSKAWCQDAVISEWRDGWLTVDGTTFPLFQKPGLHGEAWFDKSSRYSMNGQFVSLLHNLRVIDYSLGHTGSAHDSYVFQSTRVSSNYGAFLSPGEWIWADSAYPVRRWCVPPFKKPRDGELSREQKHFNYFLSVVRVRSEHAIGLLKGRFQSLRELRIQIGSHKLHRWAILWVRCCVIIHNLIIQFEAEATSSDSDGSDSERDDEWRIRCIRAGARGDDECEEPTDHDLNGDAGDEDSADDEDVDGNADESSDEPVPEIAREGYEFRQHLLHVLLRKRPLRRRN